MVLLWAMKCVKAMVSSPAVSSSAELVGLLSTAPAAPHPEACSAAVKKSNQLLVTFMLSLSSFCE
jgi:hypothetical protein